MRKIIILKGLKENVKTGMINLVSVSIIALLMGACAGTNKIQQASSANKTAQASVKNESELSEDIGDQTIVCRRRAVTGSRLKTKICKTKAQWAREDEAKRKIAEDLKNKAEDSLSMPSGSTDSMGGISTGMPR